MADTRKDKRAPISLKVRFKSATLDEFMEQYSVDISRGGIFIKSKTPMSVGTLLKFEFQLKDESRLIHGVGRVVWKRDEGDGVGEEFTPGMGIKFIKMDPESRSLVEKMVQTRGDAPGRFEEGQEPGAKPAAAASSSSTSSSSGGFFPSTTPEDELPPPEDRTMVRHASEFLASALAEGGSGSADEAEKKAEEARKRTEEIERKRKEAQQRRKPRIKKTLVGMGIPKGLGADEAIEALGKDLAGEKPELLGDTSESAETVALDREELERQAAATKSDDAAEAKVPAQAAAKAEEPAEEAEAAEEKAEAAAAKAEAAAAKADAAAAKASEPEAKPEPVAEKPAKAAPEAAPVAKAADKPKESAKKEPEKKAEPIAAKKAEPASKPMERPAVAAAANVQAPEEDKPSRMGMIFFALIAAIAVGVIVWMQVGRDETPDPAADPTPEVDEPVVDEPVVDEPVEDEPVVVEDTPEPVEDEPVEPEVETVSVQVNVRPAEAVVFVDGMEVGPGPQEVALPLGQETTVSARLAGHVEATQAVTAAEGQRPVTLTLAPMPYIIAVTTTPPGARVAGGGGRATAPGEITLRAIPAAAIELRATLRNHEDATASVSPSDFTVEEGRMVSHVTLTLTARPPSERPPVVRRGGTTGGTGGTTGGTGGTTGGGDEPPAGGGDTPPAGGGGDEPPPDEPDPPAGGGTQTPPDNPFG